MGNAPSFMGKTVLRGAAVTGFAQVVKMGVQFLSVISLARLLSPEDFGLVASVSPVIAFIVLFQDIGLQQAVIQRPTITPDQLNRIFWVTALLGAGCVGITCALSPAVAWFYGDPRLTWLTVAICLPILISSMASLPFSLLNRTMRFGALAVLDILAAVLGFLATLTGALCGLGYWSLALSQPVTACVLLFGSMLASGWRPGRPRFWIEREIFSFGANLTGFNILNFFARNLDNILIGRYVGSVPLGYYDRAFKLLLFPLQNVSWPLGRVVMPVFSRMQDDKPRLRETYLRTVGLLTLATVPGIAALTIVPVDVVRLLFGEKWLPVAPIFAWLGVAALVQPLHTSVNWLFVSQGKTQAIFRWGMYVAFTTILSFVVGLQWGAVGVAAAYTISEYAVRMPVLYWVMGRLGPVTAWDYVHVQVPLLLAAGMTWGLTHEGLIDRFGLSGVPLIAATVTCSYALALGVSLLNPQGRRTLREVFGLVRKLLAWGRGIR